MARKIRYNFDSVKTGLDDVPPVKNSFRSGPSEEDKPFLDVVARSLREGGASCMAFETTKERDSAARKIHRYIKDAHNIPVKTYHRKEDDTPVLYWKLESEEESEGEDSSSGEEPVDDSWPTA